jgi:3-hydroxybutyrate dehydrogenase
VSGALAGRHALVTGAGGGIGAAVARALASRGASVTVAGRDRARLDACIAALPSAERAHAVVADVTDERAVGDAFAEATGRFGDVAILVNNAGIAPSRAFHKMDLVLWDEVLRVNLTGAFLCCLAAVPAMKAARWGRIVNVASTAGLVGGAYIAAYTASKHGLVGLTRSLAAELVADGITANAVCPGFTQTDMLERAVHNVVSATGRSDDDARRALAANNASGRFVTPEEVAETVAWLCLPSSRAINGQAIVIAGGEARPA